MPTFDANWLALRRPFDDDALDREAIAQIKAWAASQPTARPLRVVDLGSGTGGALRRVARWLSGHPIEAFAIDAEAEVLAASPEAWQAETGLPLRLTPGVPGPYMVCLDGQHVSIALLVGDLLEPLGAFGGPPDGTVDLLLGHALADVLPLDRLAERAAALLRPGGLAHLALTYDGQTSFTPLHDRDLEARVLAAYHRHMDRPRAANPTYGGSTAGRGLLPALEAAGLEIVRHAPSAWQITPPAHPRTPHSLSPLPHPPTALLDRLLRFVVDSLLELGEPPAPEVRRWEADRRALLDGGHLGLRVGHRDVLARLG